MTLVYTFLIVFLFLMASILSTYTKKNDYLEKIDSKIKEEVKLDKSPLTGEKDTSIKAVILATNTVYADNVASAYVASAGIDFATKSSLTNGQGLYTNNKLEDGKNKYFRGGSFCAYTNYASETQTGTNCTAAGGTWSNYKCNLDLNRATCTSKGFTYNDLKNNVLFAGKMWRIIRIDENDNIRMILAEDSGESCTSYNSVRTDNAHVGYMFGPVPSGTYVEAHTNTTSSTIKSCMDSWYTSYLTAYSSSISDAGYCCDRNLNTGSGYGTINSSYYYLYRDFYGPKLNMDAWCPDKNRDLFTTTTSTIGNKKLINAIGLITADEIKYAGIVGTHNYINFLKFNNAYWTMTPYRFETSASNYFVHSAGMVMTGINSGSTGVTSDRPVIALKPTSVVTDGEGTFDDPYVVN